MLRVLLVGCAMGLLWFGQRQGELPDDGFDDRFPLRAERPKPEAGLATEQRARVMAPVVPSGGVNPCDGIAPQDQLSCPLTGRVTAIEPITNGVRLLVRRGPPPNKLRDQLVCQLSLASVKPDTPAACSFLGPDVNVVVRSLEKAITAVEILPSPPDEARVGLLQERIEAAFPNARKQRR